MYNRDVTILSDDALEQLDQKMRNEQKKRKEQAIISPFSGITTSSSESDDAKMIKVKPNTTFVPICSAQQLFYAPTSPNNVTVNYEKAIEKGEVKANTDNRVCELNRFFLDISRNQRVLNPPQRSITPPRFRETENQLLWRKIKQALESNNAKAFTKQR